MHARLTCDLTYTYTYTWPVSCIMCDITRYTYYYAAAVPSGGPASPSPLHSAFKLTSWGGNCAGLSSGDGAPGQQPHCVPLQLSPPKRRAYFCTGRLSWHYPRVHQIPLRRAMPAQDAEARGRPELFHTSHLRRGSYPTAGRSRHPLAAPVPQALRSRQLSQRRATSQARLACLPASLRP